MAARKHTEVAGRQHTVGRLDSDPRQQLHARRQDRVGHELTLLWSHTPSACNCTCRVVLVGCARVTVTLARRQWRPVEGGLRNAIDLVKLIREEHGALCRSR